MEIVLTTFAKEDIFSFPVANETAKAVPTIATTISIFTTKERFLSAEADHPVADRYFRRIFCK